jgi:DNA topoisomerase IB
VWQQPIQQRGGRVWGGTLINQAALSNSFCCSSWSHSACVENEADRKVSIATAVLVLSSQNPKGKSPEKQRANRNSIPQQEDKRNLRAETRWQ